MTENNSKKLYSRLYKRLNTSKEANEFYEAHQLYRILYNRLSAKDEVETENLLKEGAKYLLKNHQYESGADLVVLLIKYYVERGKTAEESVIVSVKEFFGQLKAESEERKTVCVWMEKLTEGNLRELWHHWLAVLLWSEDDLLSARHHFLLSGHGTHTALFLISLHRSKGYQSEVDLFLLQAVLQFLCLNKFAAATNTFVVYLRFHPDLPQGPPFKNKPLLNFLWFLLLAVETRLSSSAFKALCDNYSKHLTRDQVYSDYLTRVGQLYFKIPVVGNNDNFLSNIMNMFMKDVHGDEDGSRNVELEPHFSTEDMD